MRILTIVNTEEIFEELAEKYEDTHTIISSEDLVAETETHEPVESQYAVTFFASLYTLVSSALSHRDDVLLDCSRITEEEQAKLIRALNNTSGLTMTLQESDNKNVIVYKSN